MWPDFSGWSTCLLAGLAGTAVHAARQLTSDAVESLGTQGTILVSDAAMQVVWGSGPVATGVGMTGHSCMLLSLGPKWFLVLRLCFLESLLLPLLVFLTLETRVMGEALDR